MLRAEELRIGNIISLTGKPIRISFSTLERLCFPELSKYQMFKGKYQPIELTEEILLKCGFEKEGVTFRKGDYILWLNTFEPDYNFMLHDIRDDNLEDLIVYSKPLVDIKYLHQLQNLIYVLTGKELEVNL